MKSTDAFALLLACYRSGQMSEKQWQAHLEDKDFAAWIGDQAARSDSGTTAPDLTTNPVHGAQDQWLPRQ